MGVGTERRELGMLLGLGLCAVSVLGFGLLAAEVTEGDTTAFDRNLLLALREHGTGQPIGPHWIENFFLNVTSLGSTAVLSLMTLSIIGYLLATRRRAAAALVFVSVLGGILLPSLLKAGFDRPRPDVALHLATVYSASFPSGHTTAATATYLTLGALLARVQPRRRLKLYLLSVAILLVLLIGVSRVYLGVHWPTDVLAGWGVGAAWASICWLAARWLQRRGEVETGPGDAS